MRWTDSSAGFSAQKHPHKILIAGNHDWLFQQAPDIAHLLLEKHQGISYLQDSGVVIEGVRFWVPPGSHGSVTGLSTFPGRASGFGRHEPDPHGHRCLGDPLPASRNPRSGPHGGEHLGCEELAIRLAMVKPRVHLFGHIHDSFGVAQSTTTTYINACVSTESYKPANPPIVVDLSLSPFRSEGWGIASENSAWRPSKAS